MYAVSTAVVISKFTSNCDAEKAQFNSPEYASMFGEIWSFTATDNFWIASSFERPETSIPCIVMPFKMVVVLRLVSAKTVDKIAKSIKRINVGIPIQIATFFNL